MVALADTGATARVVWWGGAGFPPVFGSASLDWGLAEWHPAGCWDGGGGRGGLLEGGGEELDVADHAKEAVGACGGEVLFETYLIDEVEVGL